MSVNLNNSSIFSLFTKNILGMDIQLNLAKRSINYSFSPSSEIWKKVYGGVSNLKYNRNF